MDYITEWSVNGYRNFNAEERFMMVFARGNSHLLALYYYSDIQPPPLEEKILLVQGMSVVSWMCHD